MNQLKLIVRLLILFFYVSLSAQKIKIKKDVVLLDKTPIASLKEVGKTFKYANIGDESNIRFIAELKFLKINESISKNWVLVSNADNSKSTEIELEFLTFTLSSKKAIATMLHQKYEILTASGIDETRLDEFLSEERPNLTQEYQDLLKQEVAKSNEIEKAIANSNVKIKSYKSEIYNGNELIGTYTRDKKLGIINIYDLDANKVAIATVSSFGDVDIKLPFKNLESQYKTRHSSSTTTIEGLIKEIVVRINTQGVGLGHQIVNERKILSEAKAIKANDDFNKSKLLSSNLYDVKGYAIDGKGKRYEGEIEMIFEDIKDPNDPLSRGTIVNLGSGLGKTVRVKYINDKDKIKYKALTAKSGASFTVFDAEGNETLYKGIRVKSNGLLASAGSSDALSIGGAKIFYMKQVIANDKLAVYQEFPSNKYYIKLNKEEKAFDFEFGALIKEPKKIQKVKAYFGCDLGITEYNEESFLSLDKIEELINFYNNSCK
jgi:hypothetical protein